MPHYTFWHLHQAGGELIAGLYCGECGKRVTDKLVTKQNGKEKVGIMTDGQMELLINKVTGAMQLRVTEIAEMMRAYWKDCRITGERPKARDKGVEFEPPFEEQATARDPVVSPPILVKPPLPSSPPTSAKLMQMRYRLAMRAWRESGGDPSGEAAGKLRLLHKEAEAKGVLLEWDESDPLMADELVTEPIVEPPAKLSAASLVLKPAPKKAVGEKAEVPAKKGHSGASRRPATKRKR